MGLVAEYKRQYSWRDWSHALSLCPISKGQRVIDLGCGIGELSRDLAQQGAHVVGVDGNPGLLASAMASHAKGCEFIEADLGSTLDSELN